MKKIFTAVIVIFCSILVNAQDSWTYSEKGGFGAADNEFIKCLTPFKGNLYAGSGTNTGGLFRSPNGISGTWTTALDGPLVYTIDALGITSEGGGYLYASTYSYGSDSARVFRSFDGSAWTPYYTGNADQLAHIVPFMGTGSTDSIYVIENIFGGAVIRRSGYLTNDPLNTSASWQTVYRFDTTAEAYSNVTSTLVHSGRFYIGTAGGNGPMILGSNDGINWSKNDSVGYGWNDLNNYEISALEAFGGYIYAGTMNYSGAQLWRTADQLNWTLVKTYGSSDKITDLHATATELWIAAQSANSSGGVIERTSDGSTFILSSNDGFGQQGNQGGEAKFAVFGNNMYYGTRNFFTGAALAEGGPTASRGGGLSTGGQIWRTCLITPPTLDLGNDTTFCGGQSIVLDAGPGAVAYHWNNEDTTQTTNAFSVNGFTEIYSCQITATNGCDAVDFISISSYTSPSVFFSIPSTGSAYVCENDSISINAIAASGLYILDPPISKVTNDTIDNTLGDALDTLAVSGISGSCACTSLISVTIDSLSHAYLGDVIIGLYSPSGSYIDLVQFGYGGSSSAGYYGTEFRMDAPGYLSSGSPPFTGQFYPDGYFSNFTGSPNGNWILKVGDTYSFDSGNLKGWTLKFGYADTIMTFSWTPATGLTSSSILNPVITPPATTDYALTVTNSIGCPTTDTVTLIVPDIQITASTAAVCYGSSAALTATGGLNYNWSPSSGLSSTLGSSVFTNTSVDLMYYVIDTIAGCITTDSVNVIANPQVFTTASLPQTICFADTATLSATASGGTPGYTYNWNDGSINIPGQNISVSPVFGTSYTLTATDFYGCPAYDYTSVAITPSTDVVGHVTYSGGDVTSGNAVAFRYIPTNIYFDTVQVAPLNGSGNYIFTGLNSGEYLIKIFADTLVYPTLNSTYYGNEWSWEQADSIVHGCSMVDTANVVMIEELGLVTGPGNLRGRIVEDVGFGSAFAPDETRAPGEPIPGIDVKLGKNPGGAMIVSTTTSNATASDGGGYYYFPNIPYNTGGEYYTVYVDIPGLGTDSSYTFQVNASASQYLYLDYVVDSTTIHFVPNAGVGISNPGMAKENKFSVYPNPTTANATIGYSLEKDAAVSLNVYNVLGVKVSELVNAEQKSGSYKYTINSGDNLLKAGVYFITLIADEKTSIQRLVITE